MGTGKRRSFDKYEAMGSCHRDWADPGSASFEPASRARYEVLVPRIRQGAVLDIGCGDGFMMSLCPHQTQFVTGVDPEHRAVQLAQAVCDPPR